MQPNYYPPSAPNADQIHKIQDFIRSHKALSLFLAIGSVALIIGIIILMFFNALRGSEPETFAPEIAPIPAFEHRYLLNYTLGSIPATQVFIDLGNTIVSPEELDSAPSSNSTNTYTTDLVEDSFTTLRNQPNTTYKVDTKVSDGRTYTLYYRIDPDSNYIAVVLDRTDLSSGTDYIYIYTNPSLNNKESVIAQLTTWAKSLSLTNPKVFADLVLPTPEDQ